MSEFDYEAIWDDAWGDMQIYGPTHRHRRRIFADLVKDIGRQEIMSVADIGCGEGSNLLFWQKIFPEAQFFGYDISSQALEIAKIRVNASFQTLDIQKVQLEETYDFVVCAEVLEHLEDDRAAIANIYHMTNKYALFSTVQGELQPFEKTIGHVRRYSADGLRQMLEDVGFHVVQLIEWGYPFYSPLYIRLFDNSKIETTSHGSYGIFKRLVCDMLYLIFMLNREDKGEVVIALARK